MSIVCREISLLFASIACTSTRLSPGWRVTLAADHAPYGPVVGVALGTAVYVTATPFTSTERVCVTSATPLSVVVIVAVVPLIVGYPLLIASGLRSEEHT